jgi:E-phenylitaconyl-CoA hydratase
LAKKVLYDVKDKVAYITLNRPEVMNAMDMETFQLLSEAWCDIRDNPDIWVALITGAGSKAFTAGIDLKSTIPHQPEKYEFWLTQKGQLLNRGLEVWKPVIAAVNGYCLAGGMTLLLATDIRVASEDAVFEISEVKRGLIPANGGTQRILRQLPYPIAMEMILLGRRITAKEALGYGLINAVVPKDALMVAAEKYARDLCKCAPLAVRAAKELAIRSQSLPLEQGFRLEQAISEVLRLTEDAKEGPAAFAEKRPPMYKGR